MYSWIGHICLNILRVHSCSTDGGQRLHQGCGRVTCTESLRPSVTECLLFYARRHVSDNPLRCLLLSVINKQHRCTHTLLIDMKKRHNSKQTAFHLDNTTKKCSVDNRSTVSVEWVVCGVVENLYMH